MEVFSHLGTMEFPTQREAAAFFWTLADEIGDDGWAQWGEMFVDNVGFVNLGKHKPIAWVCAA